MRRSCRSLGKGVCNCGTASQHGSSGMPSALRQAAEVDDWDGGAQRKDESERKCAPPAQGAGGKVAMRLWSTVAGVGRELRGQRSCRAVAALQSHQSVLQARFESSNLLPCPAKPNRTRGLRKSGPAAAAARTEPRLRQSAQSCTCGGSGSCDSEQHAVCTSAQPCLRLRYKH